MIEASTPVNKRLRINAPDVTPLRRLSLLNKSAIPDTVEKSDDNKERERRRSQVQIRKRLSNVAQAASPANESVVASQEEINGHVQICIKLFAENKISTKNAWNLKIIDYLHKVKESLPVAATSLDVSAKVYGVKVDDAHSYAMQLATGMVAKKNKNAEEENGEAGYEGDENKENEEQKKKKQKKPKRLIAGQKATITKDPKTLLGHIPKVESTFFQTQSRADLSSVDNLFTNRFPMDSSGYRFLFEGKEKAWTTLTDKDAIVDNDVDKKFPCELPQLDNFKLCPAFVDFDLANWNPDEEDKLMNDTQRSFKLSAEPLCYENGLPVAELDGSIHDIFQNDANGIDDNEIMEEEEFVAHFQENVEHIVTLKPNGFNNVSEYSYNTTVTTQGGKIVDQIWAGPSHWKLKYIRPSTVRFSGRPINPAQTEPQKQRKKREKIAPTTLSFDDEIDESLQSVDTSKKITSKRKNVTCDVNRITLPLPVDINLQIRPLLTKPVVLHKKNKSDKEEECEIKPYNYDNPNDSFYCSQKGSDDAPYNDDCDGDFNNDEPEQYQGNLAENNLIEAPESIPKNYIQYAKHAKKMDMKKLKATVWMNLTEGKENSVAPNKEIPIKQKYFSDVYKWLPRNLGEKMRKDLSCSLAFAAVLHLCNEHNLELIGQQDLTDILIKNGAN